MWQKGGKAMADAGLSVKDRRWAFVIAAEMATSNGYPS